MAKASSPTPTEAEGQIALFDRIRRAEARHPELSLIHHVPNGGVTSGFRAANGAWVSPQGSKLRRMGQRRGIPDICIPIARGGWHGAYLELKRKGQRPTDEQKAMHAALAEQGYKVAWFDEWLLAWAWLCDYLDIAVDSYRPDPTAVRRSVTWDTLGGNK